MKVNKVCLHILSMIVVSALLYSCPSVCRSASLMPAGKARKKCPALNISVKNNRVFMDVKNAPYECVVRQMLEKSGIGFKIWDAGDRRITLRLDGVSIEAAIRSVCENYAIVYDYLPKTRQYRFAAVRVTASGRDNAPVLKDRDRAGDGHPPKIPSIASKRGAGRAAGTKNNGPVGKALKKALRPQFRPGEIIVRFKPSVNIARINELNAFIGAKVGKKIGRHGIYKVRVDDDLQVPKAIEFYRASGIVISAGRNLLRYKMSGPIPDDPYFADQWGLSIADARDAWKIEKGDSSVVVGVIDTGIDYTHPDLADNIWINEAEKNGKPGVDDDGNGYVDDIYGYDFADGNADPMDHDGHGTHVAGIIGAVANNGIGVAGVCRHVRLMALKVQKDFANDMDVFDIIEAMEYAKDKGVRIFNCSYGSGSPSGSESNEMRDFQATNGIFICAAGNDGVDTDLSGNEDYPADYDLDNIMSVAASTESDALAGFSNYGAASVDLMAPGYNILSTYPSNLASTTAGITIESTGGQIQAEGIEFAGRTDETGIQGELYDCGYGYPDEIPDQVSGNIALVKRGGREGDAVLFFSEKVENVQAKGAIGAVIYNNTGGAAGNFAWTLASAGDWIPAVAISDQDGQLLIDLLPVQITLKNYLADDSALYERLDGTSMAAPFVSGLAALLVSGKPDIDYHEIVAGILGNVDKIESVSGKLVSGGRVNLFNALGELLVPGDLTGDDKLGLDDLVLCVQILSGIANSDSVVFHPKYSDVDGDGKIGLFEAEYIFRKIAGIP